MFMKGIKRIHLVYKWCLTALAEKIWGKKLNCMIDVEQIYLSDKATPQHKNDYVRVLTSVEQKTRGQAKDIFACRTRPWPGAMNI